MRNAGRGCCLVALLSLLPAGLQAGWVKVSGGNSDRFLFGVSAPTSTDLFTIGMHFDSTGMIPKPVPHVFASADGGHTFTEITGNLATLGLLAPTAVQFLDSQHGFIVSGTSLYATDNRGGTWTTHAIGFEAGGVHFFDYESGIVFGVGGSIATTPDGGVTFWPAGSGTTVSLHQSFWLDRNRGVVSGYDERVEEDPYGGPSTTVLEHGVVLRTADGGASWIASTRIEGVGLGEPFVLADGTNGFMAAWVWVDANHNEARLYRTADGAATWADMSVPIQVGSLHMMMTAPINVDHFSAMHWADLQHGHLGGTAYVTETGSGQTPTRYWRTVDFITADGGQSWQKTDLGTIEVDLSGSTPTIQNDGAMIAGELRSFYDGVVVGEKQAVWSYVYTCSTAADCPPGYACAVDTCVPPVATCTPPCMSDETCVDGVCLPSGGDSDHHAGDGGANAGAAKEFQDEGCSCDVGSGAARRWAGLLIVGAFSVRRGRLRAAARRPPAGR